MSGGGLTVTQRSSGIQQTVSLSVKNCRRLTVNVKQGWSGGVWRRGFPLLLCLFSTCRARGNHFSTLHQWDFRPNVISFSPECLCLSHSLSLSDLLFLLSTSPLPLFFLFCCLFPSRVLYFFLFTCSTLSGILFHCCGLGRPIQKLQQTHTHQTHTIQLQP